MHTAHAWTTCSAESTPYTTTRIIFLWRRKNCRPSLSLWSKLKMWYRGKKIKIYNIIFPGDLVSNTGPNVWFAGGHEQPPLFLLGLHIEVVYKVNRMNLLNHIVVAHFMFSLFFSNGKWTSRIRMVNEIFEWSMKFSNPNGKWTSRIRMANEIFE